MHHVPATNGIGGPVRIGMFVDMYRPYVSGVTNHVSLYKAALEGLGHEVWVFTFGDRGYADDEPRVVRSAGLPFGDTGWRFGVDFSREAREAIAGLHVAHAHHPFLSGRLALRACRPLGIPVVITNHTRYDLYSDVYARLVPRPVRYAYLRRSLRAVYRAADLVISPSTEIAGWLRGFGIDVPVEVFPNAIDTRPFREPRRPWSKGDLGFDVDDVVLCYLGRLGQEKNLALLIDSFVAAVDLEPRLALTLVGQGPSHDAIEQRVREAGISDRVLLTGAVDYAQVPDILAACDVFATASVSEVHPLTVMEGMAAGLPVVGVRAPGVGETVEDGVTGFLVDEDTQALAGAMTRLADDTLRERMSEAARTTSEGFDVAPAAARLAHRFERLIARD
jgi:1,2-diacylglycerol 3-alpha-glucosyltransferase